MEVVIASSPVDAGIGCWDLRSGSEQLRYRSCSSAPHGLISIAGRFLASSQLRDSPSSASSPIFFWSWEKPQVEVRSFPAEPIGPLVSNSEGTYIMGGGPSGSIYLWEVASGKLLTRWHAHYRSVTCLTLSKDESLLISGSEDGSVRVWSLMMMFDDMAKASAGVLYRYSFSEHSLRVTDVVTGHGLCNSIIISSSEDRTCKIWSLSEGLLLRSITFPSIIDAIVMDPGEHVFYAGGRDGKIYIAALNAECNRNSIHGMFIIGALYDHSKAITCLAFSTDGVTLVSGTEDGIVRVWDTKTKHVTRVLKHAKGPINNVLIVRQPLLRNPISVNRKHLNLSLPPPLSKYVDSTDTEVKTNAIVLLQSPCHDPEEIRFCSSYVIERQIKELQKQNTSGAAEMEMERLRLECKRKTQLVQQWKKLYQDMQSLCVNELMDGTQKKGLMKVFFLNSQFIVFQQLQRRKLATQQGMHESFYRDMMVMFGKWEFDPMDLSQQPFPVHLWHGDEDGLVPVTLQRYICSHLIWIDYHELKETGHYLGGVQSLVDVVLKTLLVASVSA